MGTQSARSLGPPQKLSYISNKSTRPIHTYNNQATLKPNLPDANQHAIIYTSSSPPDEYWYEADDSSIVSENLTKDPIKVKRENYGPEGDLGTMARINYSKIYTIEHYVRVMNIGMVANDCMVSLINNSFVKRHEPIEKPRKHKSRSPSLTRDKKGKSRGAPEAQVEEPLSH